LDCELKDELERIGGHCGH